MKSFRIMLALLALSASTALAEEKPHMVRYIGEWSDSRGEVLVITAKKFRIGTRSSSFKETFRSPDEHFFRLQITSGGGSFDGRFIRIEVGREEMQMREYRTLDDCLSDRQVAAVIAWSRDR